MRKIILMGLLGGLLFGQSARNIMESVLSRDDGKSSISSLQMQLIDKNGNKRIRNLRTFAKDKGEDEWKVSFFLTPSDVKNTSFLTYDYKSESKDDDQWMYLPALKKVKRIPSSDKDSSFMGSDFSYSDMTKPDLNDYDFSIIKDTFIKRKSGKVAVWKILVSPKTQKTIDETGYLKYEVYIRKDNYMRVRAKYYLKKSSRVKYLDVKKIEKINNIDVATIITMLTKKGRKTIHKTILIQSDTKINTEIKDSFFTQRIMKQGL